MSPRTDSRTTHLYIDAGVQLVLLIALFYQSSGTDVTFLEALRHYSLHWSLITIFWQVINGLLIKFYFEQDSHDKYFQFFGYTFLALGAFFGMTALAGYIELFTSHTGYFLLMLLWVGYYLLYVPLLFLAFIGWYYYLTAWEINNRWSNTVY
jgi:hypothetical protein